MLRSERRTAWHFLLLLAIVSCQGAGGADQNTQADAEINHRTVARLPSSDSQSVLRSPTPFFQVIGGALTGTSAAVLEGSTGKLFLFDLEGTPKGTFAGRGEGPGEFTRPMWIHAHGSELIAFDRSARRLSWFTEDGELARETRLGQPTENGMVSPIGVLAPDAILAALPRRGGPVMATTPTIRVDTYDLVIVDEAGLIADTVGELVSGGTYVEPNAGGGALSMPAPFLGRSEVAVTQDGYYILDPNRGVLSKYSSNGELRWSEADFGVSREPLTPEMIEAFRARLKSPNPSPIDMVGAFDRAPKPDSLPRFGWGGGHRIPALIADASGSAWLLRYSGIVDPRMTWVVVGSDGKVIGLAHSDVETEILAIQDSLFLTRRWDEVGAETIELLRASFDRTGQMQ